ncbi:MAG: enoyl-CoA hydratase/isomerase family protein [Streptosporangiales bacterium]|nr:enoyl-CoA hydratase/isomerase family protein [Streptosporangiales bacterium]
MGDRPVLLELDGSLAWITLNRPAVLNALDLALMKELDAVTAVAADAPEVRVVVVRGAGRAFCSGLDLNMMGREGMPPGFYETQETAFRALELMDKITIAALHGDCLGGGVQLAICCDIRVCSSDCRLGLPAVLEGLFPGMAPYRLPQLIGRGPAARLILSGEVIDADEARGMGLVDHLVPADRFEGGLAEFVELYRQMSPTAAVAAKRLMRRAFDGSFEDALAESLPLLANCLASPEVEAAKQAWRDRKAGRGAPS